MAKQAHFEIKKKHMPPVVFDEESKTSHGFEIKQEQQKLCKPNLQSLANPAVKQARAHLICQRNANLIPFSGPLPLLIVFHCVRLVCFGYLAGDNKLAYTIKEWHNILVPEHFYFNLCINKAVI